MEHMLARNGQQARGFVHPLKAYRTRRDERVVIHTRMMEFASIRLISKRRHGMSPDHVPVGTRGANHPKMTDFASGIGADPRQEIRRCHITRSICGYRVLVEPRRLFAVSIKMNDPPSLRTAAVSASFQRFIAALHMMS
ncbi:hypothetical protein KCU88_g373, partial [Aureobasidium melanogenum]